MLNSKTIQLLDWMMHGRYYGYPDCCTIAFIKRAMEITSGNIVDITEEQRKISDHKGFIPCIKCTGKLIREKRDISTLISNRACQHPYPYDGTKEEYEEFVLRETEREYENETSK